MIVMEVKADFNIMIVMEVNEVNGVKIVTMHNNMLLLQKPGYQDMKSLLNSYTERAPQN